MRWPIRLQIFLPFAALLAIAVATSAVTSAVLSARRTSASDAQQLARVVESLDAANFPYTANVLERMRGLSGAEFVALDRSGQVTASTFAGPVNLPPRSVTPTLPNAATSLSALPSVEINEHAYFIAAVDTPQAGGERLLYVLYPRATWAQRRWDSAWPPLAIGGVTLLLMLLVSGWLATRFGRRIATVRDLFAELQAGRFPRLEPPKLRDELATLTESANELSTRLEVLQGEILRTERLRILAQLASGFAHQLRNAVTGARMAVQIHQRHCAVERSDDSLVVALAQLKLTEQQVRGLLSLSREQVLPPQPGDLSTVLREVAQLIDPNVQHRRIDFACLDRLETPHRLNNAESMRGALLNLVLNAIEAAGHGGRVTLEARAAEGVARISVSDDGPGPPESIRERLCEPFVSSKPEGVGLGLLLAQQAAQEHQGTLRWSRVNGLTQFVIEMPQTRHTDAGDSRASEDRSRMIEAARTGQSFSAAAHPGEAAARMPVATVTSENS